MLDPKTFPNKNVLKVENGDIDKWLKIKSLSYEEQKTGIIQSRYGHKKRYIKLNVYGRGCKNYATQIKKVYNAPLPIIPT